MSEQPMTTESKKLFKYYFAPTRGTIFPQAIELADLAYSHELLNDDGNGTCHVVSFSEDQLDLMASFYKIARNLLPPQGSHFKDGIRARFELQRKLEKEGYIHSPNKKPAEHIPAYIEIRKLIAKTLYDAAIAKYYESLGDSYYGELHAELIYLKRLSNTHLSGRDILFFRPESARSDLIRTNLSEYCQLIDNVVENYKEKGLSLPLDILKKITFTVEYLETPNFIVFLNDGKIEKQEVTKLDWHYSSLTREGRLFDKYIDQVNSCNILEEKKYDPRYYNLWTTYSPQFIQTEVLDKGYYLVNIDIYKHKNWRGGKRAPDFTKFTSFHEIVKDTIGANAIEFTGRSHKIADQTFYEVNLQRDNRKRQVIGNEFLDAIDDILREAENFLREKHGLPKIGEGWISEMTLFKLIDSVFHDAEHHVSQAWLAHQHLDIFIPSMNLAFEYQGKQHYEPIDFFGGKVSFDRIKQLDELKMKKCKSNNIYLIHWSYDESLTKEILDIKLSFIRERNR